VTADQRVTDWLESGVVALTGLIPPGTAATQARLWSAELERLSGAWGPAVHVDGARLLAERAALTGARGQGAISVGGACRLLPCADGWVALSFPRGTDLDLVAPLVEADVAEPSEAVRGWAATRAGVEVVERARLLGLAVSRVGESAPPLHLPARTLPRAIPVPLVVDFSALWAGPLCASLLGLAGARVVKVESVDRLDGARRGEPRFYDLLHAGHESVRIDPRVATHRAALADLVAVADVVVESSRPRALAGWGLSAADAVRHGTVWVAITAHGRAAGDRVGFGDDVAAGAGLVGWPPGGPVFVGDAIADPLTGLAAAVGAMRALAAGGGRLVEVAMASAVALTLDGSGWAPAPGPAADPPRARAVSGSARAAGADTARVLTGLAR
jgi:hypothetical protein